MNQDQHPTQEFSAIIDAGIAAGASDILILEGSVPTCRVDGSLRPLDFPLYDEQRANDVISSFIGQTMMEKITSTRKELDFSFPYRGLRFRCNVFFSKGVLSASVRILSDKILDVTALGVPSTALKMIEKNQGLIVVCGPTGHGKSTTLASLVNKIAEDRRGHIITIEDPIEYVFEQKKSLISQREVGSDTPSFASALRAALREDPDVVMVGEMRDLETVEAALQMAETGHLVLTSLHTNSAAQTADRIVSIFPPSEQNQIRLQLSEMLIGIISQRLLPKVQGGRILATEILVSNSAVRTVLREGKSHQIPNLIQTSASEGMVSLEKSLAELVSRGEITVEDAINWSVDPKSLKMMIY